MTSKLIRFSDDILVQVEMPEKAEQVAATNAKDVAKSFDEKIKPELIKICNSLSDAWKSISQEVSIERIEVEVGLSFEIEGNIFVTKSTAASNLTVKIVINKQ